MASGNVLAVFTPLGSIPPASNMATLDTRNNHPVLNFDASTDETIYFEGHLPDNYAGGGLTVDLYWLGASATSGTTRWSVAIEALASLDEDADSFATAATTGGTANGTSGIYTKTTLTFASGAAMDSLLAGEPFRLNVTRDADGTSGTDDMTGDAQLIRAVVKET